MTSTSSGLSRRDPNRAELFSRRLPTNSSSSYHYNNNLDRSIPSYGRSYPNSNLSYNQQLHGSTSSNYLLPVSNRSSSSLSNHRTAEELESQNDEAIDGLSAKVKMLKEITVGIGNEVKESSKLITGINDSFSEASGILSGTFRKMNRMSKKHTGRWYYWLLFLVVVFWIFVFTWLWRR
ncbi:blocked early in transport 1 [Phakopsora pachyrhizi]|nr:blocked early in transport 1 [Phakopsora pachyrhizi]